MRGLRIPLFYAYGNVWNGRPVLFFRPSFLRCECLPMIQHREHKLRVVFRNSNAADLSSDLMQAMGVP